MLQITLLVAAAVFLHDGPDPVISYPLRETDVVAGELRAQFGPAIRLGAPLEFVPLEEGGGAELGEGDRLVIAPDLGEIRESLLPTKEMTVSAWVSVSTPRRWGGVLGCVRDNGDAEQGWVLGYDQRRFTFGLATTGADDGDGKMTYLTGQTGYEPGKLYHVVGTYDGTIARLYVNGRLEAESGVQSGDILYPDKTPVVLGAYADDDEFYPHSGRLMDVRLYDMAAGSDWVDHQFQHHADRAALPARAPAERPVSEELAWQVRPYLQYATGDSVRVMFETSRPVTGVVRYGETEAFTRKAELAEPAMLGELVLDGMKPDEPYFYQVELTDDKGRQLASEVLTFQTAAPRGTPIAFAIISDTQDNPAVAGKLAGYMWGQRPGFVIHPGDLTGTGSAKGDWTDEFFSAGMGELLGRVTMYPVLGNHEEDAAHYYRYFSLPAPEYFYKFSQGDADFFMIDTNRDVSPGSEQYVWLERELSASDATWKFAVHHHPPYSSDENDYGDTWKGRSTRGDLRVRQLTALYDAYGVDMVMTGHIHSYERTWPVIGGRVVDDGGTVYTITGGGGGGLEDFSPSRPFFNNTVRRGHHYCMVRVNGGTLEFFAYDLDNRLFDQMRIEKR
jgi:hypothetical protein